MTTSLVRLMETLERARDGDPCTNREWETKVIPETVKKYLKKFDLEQTFNNEEPVNQDPELADRFFEAGLSMAAEIGVLMVDTESVIRFSREEILEAVERAPDHVKLGRDSDRITMRTRRPEDKIPPVFAGPLSIQVSEELYIPITEGMLRSPHVQVQEGPSIDTVFGLPVYSGTPFETAAGRKAPP
ncbi:MAG TPA: monomethylamine:corrinoid methyltransferase [Proteobacteria bacterium]|nr:monomethylamine:corrinoid methyltransferase [Pseudomonadota bacterium]